LPFEGVEVYFAEFLGVLVQAIEGVKVGVEAALGFGLLDSAVFLEEPLGMVDDVGVVGDGHAQGFRGIDAEFGQGGRYDAFDAGVFLESQKGVEVGAGPFQAEVGAVQGQLGIHKAQFQVEQLILGDRSRLEPPLPNAVKGIGIGQIGGGNGHFYLGVDQVEKAARGFQGQLLPGLDKLLFGLFKLDGLDAGQPFLRVVAVQ